MKLRSHRSVSKAPAPVARVLSTPELLTAILLDVDPGTLLTSAQRVSKYWHTLITTSPPIQRALWLQAPVVLSTTQPRAGDEEQPERQHNSLLAAAFAPWFRHDTNREGRRGQWSTRAFRSIPLAEPDAHAAYMAPNASWRRMLVSDPPVLKLGLWASNQWSGCIPDSKGWQFKVLELPRGLTMGLLYDLTQMWMGMGDTHFYLHWERGPGKSDVFHLAMPRDRQTGKCPSQEAWGAARASVDVVLRCERWDASESRRPKFDKEFAHPDRVKDEQWAMKRENGFVPYLELLGEDQHR